MNQQESIRRVLKEETEGIDSFLDEISSKHNMSDELKDFVKQFIEESDCKRINFSGFKMPVMGLALESGVLINKMALNVSPCLIPLRIANLELPFREAV